MKNLFVKVISPVLYLLATPALSLAATPIAVSPRPVGSFAPLGDIQASDFGQIVGSVITIAFVLAIVIALAMLVYGGIKWIISGGDKSGVEAARGTIVAAVVGLVIVFLSYFILNIVLGFFGLSLSNLQIPVLTITPH